MTHEHCVVVLSGATCTGVQHDCVPGGACVAGAALEACPPAQYVLALYVQRLSVSDDGQVGLSCCWPASTG